MTDKQKIKKFLVNKGVSKNKFYSKTGLSSSFLDRGESLGVDKLRIIIDNYPDFNLSILFAGKGEMLVSEKAEKAEKSENTEIEIENKELKAENKELNKEVRELNRENRELNTEIRNLNNTIIELSTGQSKKVG